MTLTDHLQPIADAGAEHYSPEALAVYIAGHIDQALQWSESPLGQMLEVVDGPALERVILAVLGQAVDRGPGLIAEVRAIVRTHVAGHPQRVAARKMRRAARVEARRGRSGWYAHNRRMAAGRVL